ncbi:DUF5777 family beta-barrel protein [soil metagenome]
MRNLKYILLSFVIGATVQQLHAQDDPMKILEEASKKERTTTIATFKTTRIINMHTMEVCGKRSLDFRISHRFGPFNSGSYNLWGLDGGASIRLGLEYSHNGRLMFGIGRSSYEKMADGFLKYRLTRQTEDGHTPISITLFSGMYYTLLKDGNKEANGFDKYEHKTSRMSFAHEVIIGRKFNDKISLQIAPYFLHYNLVDRISDKNDVYGVQGGLRYKFSRSMALTLEYAYNINDYSKTTYYNSFGIGFEVETGGHVFQMHVTNSFGITENQFLARTDTKWDNAGIRIGFNISRVFGL